MKQGRISTRTGRRFRRRSMSCGALARSFRNSRSRSAYLPNPQKNVCSIQLGRTVVTLILNPSNQNILTHYVCIPNTYTQYKQIREKVDYYEYE